MKSRTNTAVKEKPETQKAERNTCVHYWIVGHPKHGYCRAVCKYCGEKRAFESTFADSRWYGEMPVDFKEPVDLHSYEDTTGEFV
ncbi:hypothetical protein ACFLVP_02625 [Chloroflexota bacterium]